jgi:hypothetical protein
MSYWCPAALSSVKRSKITKANEGLAILLTLMGFQSSVGCHMNVEKKKKSGVGM